MVEDTEPGRVAVAAFDDHMGFLYPLELETHTQRRPSGTLVERITIPFQPPVAEFKSVFEQQIGRFGVGVTPLYQWTVPDAAQFNFEMVREVVHVINHADRLTGFIFEDGVTQTVSRLN